MSQYTQSQPIKPTFARHETFHPRYGWLKKGFDKNEVFSKEKDRARVVLGVGQNMVNAIRYWCLAFKILEEDNGDRINSYEPTQFGLKLLSTKGWDPYLEDPATLGLLHWNLFKPPCYATAWYFVFNEFNKVSFTTDDLLFSLKEYIHRSYPSNKTKDSSFKRDLNCILRMYVEKKSSKSLKEATIDCPFTDLGLITAYNDSRKYAFNFGNKPILSNEIVVSACLEFSSRFENSSRTISISSLLYDSGSPGQVFKLTESSLCDSIEKVSEYFEEILISDTAGMIQFSYKNDPTILSNTLLDSYYKKDK